MLDIYQEIRAEMEHRELEYISFPDLVTFLNSINKTRVHNSTIGDFLLFKMKKFNPYEHGENADAFDIFNTGDLSDITRDLEINLDQEMFFKFAYSLNDGSYTPTDWHSFFLSRSFIFKQLGVNQANDVKQLINKSENLMKPEIIEELRAENTELKTRIAELESQLQAQKESAVDFEPAPQVETYNPTERETHLLMIGAFANLLANPNKNASKYIKGKVAINQSAIGKDISDQILLLLQPETKTRSEETIKARLREAINTISKAES